MAVIDRAVLEGVLAYLREHYPAACRHWFSEIEIVDVIDGTLHLLVTEDVRRRYLQRQCIDAFTEAAQSVTGRLLPVSFVGEVPQIETSMPGGVFKHQDDGGEDEILLSPDYTFDTFVVGPDNRLAHAAALAVAEQPGRAYNPFFIHGGVGLGKTHLLQAICQTAMRTNPDMRICYISCNSFMNNFMDAVQEGKMKDFRHRFRTYDVLVVDDIHDITNRGPSQEEFFHTFNSLYQSGRQVVLSSDAPPNEIPDLEERLTSRFNSGLVAPIEKPCYETRVAILKSKATLRGIDVPDEVAGYVAARVDSNIRELEGALTTLQSLAKIDSREIDLALAKQCIGGQAQVDSSAQVSVSVQSILDTVSGFYGLRVGDLLSKRRQRSIALPRQIGMYLARRHTRFSLGEIGGYFGGRDHTTVMHAIKTIDGKRVNDDGLDRDLVRLEEALTGQDAI
ncbi:MAG: chromosomal replication initiator protein DnaA [Phycisphaerales bacterium]|nr:chromosomal replication initiator protein DnaA [Phycisphaerales bacterium]